MFRHRVLVAGEYTMRPQIEVKPVRAGTPEALWRERILQWAESGLAQVELCREHGLSLDEFRRPLTDNPGSWRSRARPVYRLADPGGPFHRDSASGRHGHYSLVAEARR